MPTRKTTIYILITVAVLGLVFGPFNAGKTDAEIVKVTRMSGAEILESILPSASLLKTTADIVGFIIWTPAKLLFTVAGYALDTSIDISINKFRGFAASDAVTTGWGLSRDIVNLFLIFILLYIAIATILQIPGYGAKELLTTLIIIAFLVNFSLVITRMIIDAANILTLEFYKPFAAAGLGVAETFRNAFDADVIMTSAFKDKDGNENIYLVKIITFLFGGVILLIAAFIFLMFAVLFLIRIVSLLILMIFSPLAFAAYILPSTKNHAKKWWDYLLSQAFFAPAALFMLWISANVANSGFIKEALGLESLKGKGLSDMLIAASKAGAAEASDWNWDNILKFIIQFVIIAILLVFSLVVAKQIGAAGADSVQKGFSKAGKKLQGYAGRTAIARPARLFTESRLGQAIGRTALGGMLYRGVERAAKVGKLEEITARKIESQARLGLSLAPRQQTDYFQKLGSRAQEAMYNKMSDQQRGAVASASPNVFDPMFSRLKSRIGETAVTGMKSKLGMSLPTEAERFAFFRSTDSGTQKEMFKQTSARDRSALTKTLPPALAGNLMGILSTEEREKTEKAGKEAERKETIKNLTIDQTAVSITEFTTAIPSAKPEEMSNLHKSIALDPAKINEMLKVISDAHLKKIDDRGDELSDVVIDELYKLDATGAKNAANIAAALRGMGNNKLARTIETGPVRARLGLT